MIFSKLFLFISDETKLGKRQKKIKAWWLSIQCAKLCTCVLYDMILRVLSCHIAKRLGHDLLVPRIEFLTVFFWNNIRQLAEKISKQIGLALSSKLRSFYWTIRSMVSFQAIPQIFLIIIHLTPSMNFSKLYLSTNDETKLENGQENFIFSEMKLSNK